LPSGWTEEWYNDKTDYASADPIYVFPGSNRGGVNIEINDQTEEEDPGGIIIVMPAESGVVARQQQPVAEMETEVEVVEAEAVETEAAEASDEDGSLDQGTDPVSLPDEDQHDIVGDGGYDEPVVSQVERDEAPLA
jgi:hypothetical protein